jgi:tetratricopeptide (TPR) repeat protein
MLERLFASRCAMLPGRRGDADTASLAIRWKDDARKIAMTQGISEPAAPLTDAGAQWPDTDDSDAPAAVRDFAEWAEQRMAGLSQRNGGNGAENSLAADLLLYQLGDRVTEGLLRAYCHDRGIRESDLPSCEPFVARAPGEASHWDDEFDESADLDFAESDESDDWPIGDDRGDLDEDEPLEDWDDDTIDLAADTDAPVSDPDDEPLAAEEDMPFEFAEEEPIDRLARGPREGAAAAPSDRNDTRLEAAEGERLGLIAGALERDQASGEDLPQEASLEAPRAETAESSDFGRLYTLNGAVTAVRGDGWDAWDENEGAAPPPETDAAPEPPRPFVADPDPQAPPQSAPRSGIAGRRLAGAALAASLVAALAAGAAIRQLGSTPEETAESAGAAATAIAIPSASDSMQIASRPEDFPNTATAEPAPMANAEPAAAPAAAEEPAGPEGAPLVPVAQTTAESGPDFRSLFQEQRARRAAQGAGDPADAMAHAPQTAGTPSDGGPGVAEAAVGDAPVTPERKPIIESVAGIREIQRMLGALGYNVGPTDGIYGPHTHEAIKAYQTRYRLPVDGKPTPFLADRLAASVLWQDSLRAFNRQDYEAAIAGFSKLITLRPDSADAVFNRGLSLQRLGRLAEAETDFRAALALDPRHSEAHLSLANLMLAQGRYLDAVGQYVKTTQSWF